MSVNQYFVITGNPFVDGGIFALSAYLDKDYKSISKQELEEKIEEVIDLYLKEAWKKQLHSVFTGNSSYLSPSYKSDKERKKKSLEFLRGLLNTFTFPSSNGDCVACGRRTAFADKTREKIPLTGSGKLMNYFSGYLDGERYCSVCTFAVQFLPLFLYSLGKYFLLFHCISEKLMRIWAEECVKSVHIQKSSGNYTGFFQHGYKNGENALFYIVEKMIRDREELLPDDNPSISAYIFSNYIQNPPPLKIIHLPNEVFRFLIYIQRLDYSAWQEIVRRGYDKIKGEEDYKWRDNKVYRNLLEKRSIVKYFLSLKDRIALANWQVMSYYLKEVIGMRDKRIEVIRKVADKIAEYIKGSDNTRRLYAIETCKSFDSFRNILLKITKYTIKNKSSVLFTMDEYIEDLFPEGALNWRETRDIILFRIYEKLASFLRERKEIDNIEVDDDNEEV